MKLVASLICVFMATALSPMKAFSLPYQPMWYETDPVIKEGTITNFKLVMGGESDEYFYYIDLDDRSRWKFVDCEDAYDLNWRAGDFIKIFYDPKKRQHSAENLDKQNWAFLIRLR